jgi:hypothetical protein
MAIRLTEATLREIIREEIVRIEEISVDPKAFARAQSRYDRMEDPNLAGDDPDEEDGAPPEPEMPPMRPRGPTPGPAEIDALAAELQAYVALNPASKGRYLDRGFNGVEDWLYSSGKSKGMGSTTYVASQILKKIRGK